MVENINKLNSARQRYGVSDLMWFHLHLNIERNYEIQNEKFHKKLSKELTKKEQRRTLIVKDYKNMMASVMNYADAKKFEMLKNIQGL